MVSRILSRALVSFPGMPLFRPVDSRPMFPQNVSRLLRRCLIFVSLCSPALALNPSQPLAQFYHTSWNAKQGVTGNVTALAQTTDGYLWVGTTDGLLRFDGISLQRYQADEGALMATNVSALMAVPDGGLWVGFNRGGASFIRNGRVTTYSNSDRFPVSTVRCFARDRTGAIWVMAVGGFARFDGQRRRMSYKEWGFQGETAWQLLVDREGTLWVAAGSQIVYMPHGEKRFQSTGIRTGKASALLQALDGSIWFHDDEREKSRRFRQDNGKWIEVLPDTDVSASSAIFDRDGTLWVGGYGLSRVRFPAKARGFGFRNIVEMHKQVFYQSCT
jgi:streptogramin lyase